MYTMKNMDSVYFSVLATPLPRRTLLLKFSNFYLHSRKISHLKRIQSYFYFFRFHHLRHIQKSNLQAYSQNIFCNIQHVSDTTKLDPWIFIKKDKSQVTLKTKTWHRSCFFFPSLPTNRSFARNQQKTPTNDLDCMKYLRSQISWLPNISKPRSLRRFVALGSSERRKCRCFLTLRCSKPRYLRCFVQTTRYLRCLLHTRLRTHRYLQCLGYIVI